MLGDKAYDSAELRDELTERGTKPVIPNRSNRKQPFRFSKRLYKLRWRIESAFNRLKDFRRIATRYDRLARNYLASVCLAAALVWWIVTNATLVMATISLFDLDSAASGLNATRSYIEGDAAIRLAPGAMVVASRDFGGQTLASVFGSERLTGALLDRPPIMSISCK